ncbi:hypothetical protein [Leucobacter sp. M11]|uniref:hypothetical protein n=1 Tax=Leucobacter sp. M11 TaxID=2993565 RepID=UPI002D7FDA79|nr:hypothetical protein [Leucobacter sp. M11]MEB4613983.1 hypothetical protein [Leucobacter sp. M11]
MSVTLASRGRLATALIPAAGFFATPFLPFAQEPTLWFGLPAVLVWSAGMVILTVITLQVIESSYLNSGGREQDAAEEERLATERIAVVRAERIAAEDALRAEQERGETR